MTGLDLNAGMLAVARSVPNEGATIRWMEGSALDLPFGAQSFDVVMCQLGVQFFTDQLKALHEMRRVLRPVGRVAVSVYSPIERTPGAHAFVRALEKMLGADGSRIKRGEHFFAHPRELATLLRAAGFASIEVHTVTQTLVFPSVLDYVRFQLLASPMTVLLRDRQEAERDAIIASVASETGRLSTTFPQEAYVAVARSH